MSIPEITTIHGTRPGKTVVILGATHGDEPGGVTIVNQLKATLTPDQVHGTLHLGIGNPNAYQQGTRSADTEGSLNLNRVFNDTFFHHPAYHHLEDVRRAKELAPLLQETDILIDLHATSQPSEPFICFGRDPERHQALFQYAFVHRIITDPYEVLSNGPLNTSDAYVDAHGGIGLCYETGQWSNEAQVQEAYEGVLNMLRGIGCLEGASTTSTAQVFALVTSGKAATDSFIFEPQVQDNWSVVKAGDLIGRHGDGTPLYAEQEGYIIFQSRTSHVTPGATIFNIAQPVGKSATIAA